MHTYACTNRYLNVPDRQGWDTTFLVSVSKKHLLHICMESKPLFTLYITYEVMSANLLSWFATAFWSCEEDDVTSRIEFSGKDFPLHTRHWRHSGHPSKLPFDALRLMQELSPDLSLYGTKRLLKKSDADRSDWSNTSWRIRQHVLTQISLRKIFRSIQHTASTFPKVYLRTACLSSSPSPINMMMWRTSSN